MRQTTIIVGLVPILIYGYFIVLTEANYIYGIDGYSDEEVVKIKKLTKQFIKINKLLEQKIPDELSSQKSIQVAEDKLDELGDPSSFVPSFVSSSKQSYREALELFVSLPTLGHCDTGSYEKLSKILLATRESIGITVDFARIDHVVEHFFERHSELCRSKYTIEVLNKLQHIDKEDLFRINQALDRLTVAHFLPESQSLMFSSYLYDLLGMEKISFLSRASGLVAQQEISEQIMNQLKGSPNESLTNSTEISGVNQRETLRSVLDDYLFEPCTNYRHELGSLLTEARLYVASYNGKFYDYIRDDDKFYHALINNRLCKSLIEERNKLYELFFEAWNNVLASNIQRQ